MKRKSKPADLLDAIRGLAEAMKPTTRKVTKGHVEKIIQDARCVARKERPNLLVSASSLTPMP